MASLRGLPLQVVLLVVSLSLCHVLAGNVVNAAYPACLGGSSPRTPKVTPTRCLDAKALLCSEECSDLEAALKIVSANGTTVLNQISQGLGQVLGGKDLRVSGVGTAQ